MNDELALTGSQRNYSRFSVYYQGRLQSTDVLDHLDLEEAVAVNVSQEYPEIAIDELISIFFNTWDVSEEELDIIYDHDFASHMTNKRDVLFFTAGNAVKELAQSGQKATRLEQFSTSTEFLKYYRKLLPDPTDDKELEKFEFAMGHLFCSWWYANNAPNLFVRKYNSIPNIVKIRNFDFDGLTRFFKSIQAEVQARVYFRHVSVVCDFALDHCVKTQKEFIDDFSKLQKYAPRFVKDLKGDGLKLFNCMVRSKLEVVLGQCDREIIGQHRREWDELWEEVKVTMDADNVSRQFRKLKVLLEFFLLANPDKKVETSDLFKTEEKKKA